MQVRKRRSKDLSKHFTKIFKRIDVEGTAEKMGTDEFSKKVGFKEHLSIISGTS